MKKNRGLQATDNSEKPTLAYSIKNIFCDKPNIEISDNTLANIEGSKGVLEYSETLIRVNLGLYIVGFHGRRLRLKCISPTALVIEGFFQNIDFTV